MPTITAGRPRRERAEPDDLVDPVEELGPEERRRVAGEVARHDEHDVREVDGAALAVGEAAVVEHLQQHVEHVGVRLLDLVEEHDRVGPAAHRLGELAALLVADVARAARRPGARPRTSPCTRSCRCAPSRGRRRRGTRRARGRARSCRRRSGRGRGTSRSGGSGRDSPARDCGGSRWRPRRRPRPGRRRGVCRSSSMRTSLSTSPSMSLATGTPVQRLTTSATSSASTSSFRKAPWSRWSSASSLGRRVDRALERRAARRSAAAAAPAEVALALEALGLDAALLELGLGRRGSARWPAFSACQRAASSSAALALARRAPPRGARGARR